MGILSEVISRDALERSWERGEARHRSELVALYIKEHPDEFRIALGQLPAGLYRPEYRLTVDEPEPASYSCMGTPSTWPKPAHRRAGIDWRQERCEVWDQQDAQGRNGDRP